MLRDWKLQGQVIIGDRPYGEHHTDVEKATPNLASDQNDERLAKI